MQHRSWRRLELFVGHRAVVRAEEHRLRGQLPHAAAGATIPDDFRVSITNAPGAGAYPISSFTWLLLYQQPSDTQRAKLMVDFAKWALTDGQKYAADLHYAPVPDNVVQRELAALATIKVS